jgi:hypothetical protein
MSLEADCHRQLDWYEGQQLEPPHCLAQMCSGESPDQYTEVGDSYEGYNWLLSTVNGFIIRQNLVTYLDGNVIKRSH